MTIVQERRNRIKELSLDFSLIIVEYCEALEKKQKFIIAKQLFRSGTAIGALVREAQNSESRKDFIHKMKIAGKEAEETEYWLMICNRSKHYIKCEKMLSEIRQIILIISSIIKTSIINIQNKDNSA